MIITDIEKLREIPIGEKVTLILDFQVVRTDINGLNPCSECIFSESVSGSGCNYCSARDRDDEEEVKYIKI